jgi:transcriptional regulator with XRE-family HTH domain
MKLQQRTEARHLRQDYGWSIKQIAQNLNVSPSSVSTWTRDIVLTPEQQKNLDLKNPALNPTGTNTNTKFFRDKRKISQNIGASQIGNPEFAAGCCLYWGEGSKNRNSVSITNTDTNLLVFFLQFIRNHFVIDDNEIHVTVSYHVDNGFDKDTVEGFWLQALNLPKSCLRKPILDSRSRSATKAPNKKYPFGCCRIEIGRTDIIQAIYGGIQALGGFTKTEWLD